MHRGYIKLWRKFKDNPLWKERREYSKAEAWLDILMEVQHSPEPKEIILGNKVLTCHQGESLKSLETWAIRWGWSKSKVRRVLDLFQRCSMIRHTNEMVTTRLIVCNYETYNKARYADESQMKRKRNASETHSAPDKNGKHVKNGKGDESPPSVETLRQLTRFYPAKGIWGFISQTIGDKPEDLDFWKRVVEAWLLRGWSPKNVKGMLEFYSRREIPGEKPPEPQQNVRL